MEPRARNANGCLEVFTDAHSRIVFLLFACLIIALVPHFVRAVLTDTAIATEFPVQGEVQDGDLISYNPALDQYARTTVAGDEYLFGVAVEDPLLLVTDTTNVASGSVAVIRFGEAWVRVSTQGGTIAPGDYVTSSRVPGVATKVSVPLQGNVLGMALEAFPSSEGVEETVTLDGRTERIGRIPVALRIGTYVPREGMEGGTQSTSSTAVVGTGKSEKGATTGSAFDLLRYLLAALVALGALFIALRNFGGSLSESITSVGRNPLAKTYILSMMFWNSVLIIAVCLVGFGIGAFIIMYPI